MLKTGCILAPVQLPWKQNVEGWDCKDDKQAMKSCSNTSFKIKLQELSMTNEQIFRKFRGIAATSENRQKPTFVAPPVITCK